MYVIAMIMIIIATISTNTAANIVSPTNVFQNVAPKLINEDRGVIITGLIGLARQGHFKPNAKVLFMHTGGQPAIFGYEGMLSQWLEPVPDAIAAPGG